MPMTYEPENKSDLGLHLCLGPQFLLPAHHVTPATGQFIGGYFYSRGLCEHMEAHGRGVRVNLVIHLATHHLFICWASLYGCL